ncbi:hypothetical protein SpCBS45565_g05058 [Spizellomyces sp. 'palustris']|nr:hypothetical protein SpCBS45565_g05058 [Spizellomyces sp. 'palustris']
MSHAQTRICRSILTEHFGPLVEKVCTVLLQRGRSNMSVLVRATDMPPRQIRESLFVLIQHNIVTYAEAPEGTRMVVYYQADVRNIILRDRFPLYIRTVQARFGEESEKILREVLRHGRISYLFLSQSKATKLSREQLTDWFVRLVDEKVLVECTHDDSLSIDDKRMQEEATEVAKRGGLPLTATEMTKLRRDLAQKREVLYDDTRDTGTKRKIVRDLEEVAHTKFQKFANDGGEEPIDGTKFYRANYDRLHVYLRNEEVAKVAEQRINKGAGEVVRKLLASCEHKMRRCKGEWKSDAVSQIMLASTLDPQVPLAVDDSSANPVVDYLEALAQDDTRLVSKESEGGGGQYSVNLKRAGEELQGRLMESIVQEKFGDAARRIWRILLMMNKLNETQIAKFALIPAKEARHYLYAMLNSGLAFIQDVPKTLDHSAARTFFLWYVSVPRSATIMIESAYRTLGNLKQRRTKEVAARARLIDKMQRLDVISGDARLSEGELKAVAQLNQVVGQLLCTEVRMSQFLMILEEF